MLAVRFDIVVPSVGPLPNVDDQNETEIVLVISVTCNIFFRPQKKTRSEKKSIPNFGDNNEEDEVQSLIQYIIQPYLIVTNFPKKAKINDFIPPNKETRQLEKFQFPEVIPHQLKSFYPGFSKVPEVAFVPVAKLGSEVVPMPPLSILGQFPLLFNLPTPKKSVTSLYPETPDLLPVSKLGIPVGPLSQPAVPLPVEPLPVTEKHPTTLPVPQEPELVLSVRKILSENSPSHVELCEEGVGGTYFIRDKQDPRPLAVFKPSDEEPGATLNPKNKLDHPLLPPGGGAKREYATYLLDQGHAGVPETHLVGNIRHRKMSNGGSLPIPKSGSLQRFVKNKGDSSSMSPSRFSVDDVHAIAILDLRILNLDRNGENLLVCAADEPDHGVRLVPIDHSYVLPPSLDGHDPYFEWHYWRQTKEPLSPTTRTYVAGLDPERDAERLRAAGLDEESIRTMKIATLLLQKGVDGGLTLFDIACMVCRGRNQKSELSEIVSRAENAPNFWSELTFLIEQAVLSKKDRK